SPHPRRQRDDATHPPLCVIPAQAGIQEPSDKLCLAVEALAARVARINVRRASGGASGFRPSPE
ncbi:MAG: hypothetical protein ACM31O_17740, partial [Bacteroidota bacterium]